jgi:hypothetical protein
VVTTELKTGSLGAVTGWRGTLRGAGTGSPTVQCVHSGRSVTLFVQAERLEPRSGPLLIRGFGVEFWERNTVGPGFGPLRDVLAPVNDRGIPSGPPADAEGTHMTSANPARSAPTGADHCPAVLNRWSMASAPVVMTGRNSFR